VTGDGGRYAGRVAVVTGASRGLGADLCRHLLANGASVVGFSRGAAAMDHDGYRHLPVDVGDEAAVRDAVVEVGRMHGRLDILVNNAAVLTSIHALVMPAGDAEAMLRTNLLGTFLASREAAKLMRRHRYGRIVNIGSMAAAMEPVGDSVYAATKAATMTLAGVLAKELAGYGITVNTLAVSALETDMLRQLPRAQVDRVVAGLPLPRMATIEDITNVLDFFAAEASGYVTAQAVFLGGIHP
jgi:3-oxoacyl-[acyl-carrier protein] reductase